MDKTRTIASVMNALSHPRRIALFDILEEAGPKGVGFESLLKSTKFTATTLRHHLRPMQAAGLVIRRREGVNVIFRLHGREAQSVTEDLTRRLSRIPPAAKPRAEPPPLN